MTDRSRRCRSRICRLFLYRHFHFPGRPCRRHPSSLLHTPSPLSFPSSTETCAHGVLNHSSSSFPPGALCAQAANRESSFHSDVDYKVRTARTTVAYNGVDVSRVCLAWRPPRFPSCSLPEDRSRLGGKKARTGGGEAAVDSSLQLRVSPRCLARQRHTILSFSFGRTERERAWTVLFLRLLA